MGTERGPTISTPIRSGSISLGPPKVGGNPGSGIRSFRPSFAPESSIKTSFNFVSKIKPLAKETPIRAPFEKPKLSNDLHQPSLNRNILKNTRPIDLGDISMPDRGGRLIVPGIVKNAMVVEMRRGEHMLRLTVNEGSVKGRLRDLLVDTKPLRLTDTKNSEPKTEQVRQAEILTIPLIEEFNEVKKGHEEVKQLQKIPAEIRPLRKSLALEKKVRFIEQIQKDKDEVKIYPNNIEKTIKEVREFKNDVKSLKAETEQIRETEQAVELQKVRETYEALALVLGEEKAKNMVAEAVKQKGVVEQGKEEEFVGEAVKEELEEGKTREEEEKKEFIFEEDPKAQSERMRKAGDALMNAQIQALGEGRDYILGSEVAARMPSLEWNRQLLSEIAVRIYDGSYIEAVNDISRLGRMETFFEAALRVSEKIYAKPAVRIREVVTTKPVSNEDVRRVNEMRVESIINKYLSKS